MLLTHHILSFDNYETSHFQLNDVYIVSISIDKTIKIWEVGLDVVRTDRALAFYESESNRAKLADILAVYAWVDSDIGYVQG